MAFQGAMLWSDYRGIASDNCGSKATRSTRLPTLTSCWAVVHGLLSANGIRQSSRKRRRAQRYHDHISVRGRDGSASRACVCVCACVVVVGGGVVVSGGGGGGVRVCVCGGSSLEGLYKVIDIFLMRSMAVWGHMEMVAFAEPSEDWHCASLSRSGEEGGTFTMAIAVRGKLELPGLTMAAELGAGGWLHYGDCRAPDAETEECDRRVSSLLLRNSGKADGCTMASAVRRMLELKDAQCPALPRHCLAVCSTVAADLQASADRWLGPALCGVRPADAACRCDLRSQGCTVS